MTGHQEYAARFQDAVYVLKRGTHIVNHLQR
jgi:hypothetical protein